MLNAAHPEVLLALRLGTCCHTLCDPQHNLFEMCAIDAECGSTFLFGLIPVRHPIIWNVAFQLWSLHKIAGVLPS